MHTPSQTIAFQVSVYSRDSIRSVYICKSYTSENGLIDVLNKLGYFNVVISDSSDRGSLLDMSS